MDNINNPPLLVKLGVRTVQLPAPPPPACAFIRYRLTPDGKHLRPCGYDWRRAAANGFQQLPQQQQQQTAPREQTEQPGPPPKGPLDPADYAPPPKREPKRGADGEAKFREIFRIKKLADMSRQLPPEIIRGVLYRGGKLLIGGGSKARKSFALLHLAYCAGNGLPWLGWAMPPGKVLFINLELFEAEAAARLDKIAAAVGAGTPDNIEVACLRGKLTSVEEIRKHADAIKDCDYQLIVIDPAYKLLQGRDENTAGDVADLLNTIEAVAEKTNTAVAIAQHFSKGNQQMKDAIDRFCGSGVWGRDPDALIILTQHKEPDCYTADVILRSFAPEEPFVVRFDFPLFVVDAALDPEALKAPPGKKPGTYEQQYSAEELVAPFRKDGAPAVLSLSDWLRRLADAGQPVARSTLWRRVKEEPGFPAEQCSRGKYRLKQPHKPGNLL